MNRVPGAYISIIIIYRHIIIMTRVCFPVRCENHFTCTTTAVARALWPMYEPIIVRRMEKKTITYGFYGIDHG